MFALSCLNKPFVNLWFLPFRKSSGSKNTIAKNKMPLYYRGEDSTGKLIYRYQTDWC